MSQKTCRHCDIIFQRPDDCPIPHDRCEECHSEMEAFMRSCETPRSVLQYDPADVAFKRDPVNHPAHYQSDDGVECIDAIRAALGLDGFVAHCRGTAIKYAWRAGQKGDAAECLRKGAWYLTKAAAALEGGE